MSGVAKEWLDDIDEHVKGVELRTAVRYYLFGLPFGFVNVAPLVL